MSVLSVCKINAGREGEWIVHTMNGLVYKPKYVEQYRAITDDPETEQAEVLGDAGLPAFHAAYVNDADAICSSKRARVSDDNPYHWIITVEFIDKATLVDTNIELDVGIHRYQVPFTKAYDGSNALIVPVLNAANMAFEPPPTKNKAAVVLHFVKYVAYTSLEDFLAHIKTYNDTLNENDLSVDMLSRTCKMAVKGKRIKEQDHYVSMFDYEIEWHEEGWDQEIMNRGFHYLPGGVGPGRSIRNEIGDRPASPIPLAVNGDKLAVGDVPNYLTYKEFRTEDWTPLGLG